MSAEVVHPDEVLAVHDQLIAEAVVLRGRGGEERCMLAVRLDLLAARLERGPAPTGSRDGR